LVVAVAPALAQDPPAERGAVPSARPGSRPGATTATDAPETGSSPEALAAYAKAATFQNNGAFDLAAEAWQSFLKAFAADPKATEARYNLGVCFLELKDFAQARQYLRQAIDAGKDFPRREDAHLNLGWALYTLALQNQPALFAEAESAFAALLERFPEGQYRDQALFLQGESRYMQGKRAEAAVAYQQLLDRFPDTELKPNALYALGVTLEELGKATEAGAIYERYLQDHADQPLAAEVEMRRAETILQAGDFAEAERRFAKVAALPEFPSVDHARYRQAYCVARQERFAEAAELFAAIPAQFPQSRYVMDATMAAARAYFRADNAELAQQWFEKLVGTDGPYAAESAHWLARLRLKAGDAAGALQLIEAHLPRAQVGPQPFYVNLRMDQADALYEIADRKAQAIDQYLRLVKEFPAHLLAPQAQYNAAFGALEMKDYARGLTLANEFLKNYPEHRLIVDVKQVAAECQLQLGDTAAAADTFAELANRSEGTIEAGQLQLRQAVALYMQKKYEETIQQVQTSLPSLSSGDAQAEAHFLIGMSQFSLQQFPQAKESLLKSLQAAPKWRQADEALLNLSRAQRKLKELDQAKASIERLLREYPDTKLGDQAYFRRAEYCYALNDFRGAADDYQRVIRDWPDSSLVPFSLYGAGWAALKSADLAAAQQSFQQLLQRFPDHTLFAQGQYALAMTLQQAGQFDRALEEIENYLQRPLNRAEQSEALYVQGLCLVGKKDYPRAIQTLQQLIDEDPDYAASDKVLYELAWAHKTSQQADQAITTFRQLATRHPDSSFTPEAWYHIGEAAYERQQYDEALQAYEQAATRVRKQDSDLAEKVRYKLGWSAYQRQDYDRALNAFGEQLAASPDGDLAGDAYFMQGECYLKKADYAEALESYRQARERKLSSEQIATLTYLHAGQSAGQLGQWKESAEWLNDAGQRFPNSPLLLQVRYELALAQQNLGQAAEAQQLFAAVADRGNGELAARARFMLGEVLYGQRQHAQAIREFRKVMFGFDAQAAPDVRRWQAKAGIEAGQCAGVLASLEGDGRKRQQYIDLAVRFFQYVQTRHPNTDEATVAEEQLKKYGQ
jgi:TolA-binding protein